MKNISLLKLFISLLLCFGAAGLGSVFTTPSITTWYATLTKPPFNPPNWIFGPVWTVLYTFMAVSLALIWGLHPKTKNDKKNRREGISYFFIQLTLNSLWSIVFFGVHMPLTALFVILAMWMTIYQTIEKFMPLHTLAGRLLIPYLLWVSFATILNLSIVLLN